MKIQNALLVVLAAALAAPSGSTVSAGAAQTDQRERRELEQRREQEREGRGEKGLEAPGDLGPAESRLLAEEEQERREAEGQLTAIPSLLPFRNPGAPGMIIGRSVTNDQSPALRDMKLVPASAAEEAEGEANENPKVPHTHVDRPDPVLQGAAGPRGDRPISSMPSPILNFDGIVFPGVACNCAPPDTNGEVGLTQYVQMVNNGFQVFNKATGASIFGPAAIGTLWAGFGGVCEFNGRGDPVVMYDQLADRWILTQFAGTSVPTDECIAVSQTGDATGAYYRYDFNLGTNFFDYPHLGVWPDGYYMAMNVFNAAGSAFLGPQAFVFDRAKMLAGVPATFLTPGVMGPGEDTFLPADLDGFSLPPAGAPNSFVQTPFTGAYRTWHFAVDWVTPANSSFTLFASPPAAGFTELCPSTRNCIPQLGGTLAGNNGLDGIGDRLMYRLAYRNIGGVESLVGTHTVDGGGGVAAPRWFELGGVTAGPVTVTQESTYAPDATHRWMSSVAMDNQGNLALGYSASSASINPQIRYAGRLAGDPLSTLPQAEVHLFDGAGSQTGSGNRWGDYSDMTVDPTDDCTFWYTQEYYNTTATFNWRTRIGNFAFPTCTPSARGTISGTITNCSTSALLPNAQVSIQGGYGRATNALGTYSAIVAPGTYSASVTAVGYDVVSTTGLVVSNGGTATFDACLTPTSPEINVKGNGIDIVDGDSTPSSADGTSFGVTDITAGAVVHTFTVQNVGAIDLTVGLPTITGPDAADFSVSLAPTSPVAPAGSTTFQVTFDPSTSGPKSAAISFANSDSDENPYDFSIAGTGTNGTATCPQVVLPANGGTSGNMRAPHGGVLFGRVVYLITPAEMAAAGYTSGISPTSIGWRYSTAGSGPATGSLIVYLQNTADVTNTKSTTWATAITGMTMVHNASTTLPNTTSPFDVNFAGGSPFTYTGGGLYVAFDWQWAGPVTTGTVVACTTTLANGLLGAQSNAAAPATLAASSFRPETRLTGVIPMVQNDATVSLVQSYGELPLGLASQITRAVVTNNGAAALTNVPVTLNVSGGDTFTNMQTIAVLPACGGQASVSFANFTPTALGSDTVAVSVPADDVPGNNSLSKALDVTPLSYSYKHPGSTRSGGVGFNGATGAFVARFTTAAANAVEKVKLEFNSVTATTYRIAIYGDSGLSTPTVAPLYVDAADRTIAASGPVTITLPSPVAVSAGNFFVGVQQTNTTNTSLSYDTETPIRSGSFFLGSPNPPAAWSDFAPANSFKINVGVILAPVAPTVTTPTSASITAATATLGGNVASDGGSAITDRGVVYSITTVNGDPLIGGSGVTQVSTAGTTGVFTAGAAGLAPGTGYSFKAYATNAIGTSYTNVATFTTAAVAPTVTTPTSSSITGTTATLGGDVTADGGSAISERGVVYAETATNNDPLIGGTGVTKVPVVGTTGSFAAGVTGLSPTTGHSFKAFATNAIGTSYTSVATFSTTCPVITLSSLPAGNVNSAYTGSASASGGTGPYTYAVTSGTLPTGLTLTASGAGAGNVTGTPTAAATYNFDITATDTSGAGTCTGVASYSVVIGAELGQDYFAITPCRVLDTRNAVGPLGGPALVALADRIFPVAGTCGIPADAKAISLNIAVTQPTVAGNIRLHAGGTAVPLVSSINYKAGQTRSNNGVIPLSALGELAAYLDQFTGTAHLIIDVNGYFKP